MVTPIGTIPTVWGVFDPLGTITYTLTATGGSNGTQTKTAVAYYPGIDFVVAPSSPAAQTVSQRTTNVHLADFNLTLTNNTGTQTLSSLYFQTKCLPVTGANPFSNVRFKVGTTTIATLANPHACAGGYSYDTLTLVSPLSFAPGQTKKIEVYGDITTGAIVGGVYTISLSGNLTIAYSASGIAFTTNPITISAAVDMCSNIEGIQTTIPRGMVRGDKMTCITPPVVAQCAISSTGLTVPASTTISSGVSIPVAWSVSNCTSVILEANTGSYTFRYGSLSPSGTFTFVGNANTVYSNADKDASVSLIAFGPTNTVSVTKTVPILDVVTTAAQCVVNSFAATPSTVAFGAPVTLSWSLSSGCVRAFIDSWQPSAASPYFQQVVNNTEVSTSGSLNYVLQKPTSFYISAYNGASGTSTVSAKTVDAKVQ